MNESLDIQVRNFGAKDATFMQKVLLLLNINSIDTKVTIKRIFIQNLEDSDSGPIARYGRVLDKTII